jgi:hypothetical protein
VEVGGDELQGVHEDPDGDDHRGMLSLLSLAAKCLCATLAVVKTIILIWRHSKYLSDVL